MVAALVVFALVVVALGSIAAIWPARTVEWAARIRRDLFGRRIGGAPGLTTPRIGGILLIVVGLGMIVVVLTLPA